MVAPAVCHVLGCVPTGINVVIWYKHTPMEEVCLFRCGSEMMGEQRDGEEDAGLQERDLILIHATIDTVMHVSLASG